ncbi:MAG: isoprenyl transferase [Candidatus Palauibacterales bacterium]|nr:isoprenyl transferase [Candidatus Palauibacterales bacterium]
MTEGGAEQETAAAGDGASDEVSEEAAELRERVLDGNVPRHVAVIMDGNGRWAAERDLPRWEGHRRGMETVRQMVKASLAVGLEHLTLYAFSEENWQRPEPEVAALMELLQEYVASEKEELRDQGVRVQVFGDLERLSESATRAVEELQGATREGEELQLNLAISYGSRTEIVQAAQRLAELAVLEAVRPEEITEERFEEELYTAGWPDPDLLIRTSGERRLSNFLLWQIAYAELHVSEVLWPSFGRADFYEALLDFQSRDRRFGKVQA